MKNACDTQKDQYIYTHSIFVIIHSDRSHSSVRDAHVFQ